MKHYNIIILGNGAAAFGAAIKASEIDDKMSILMVGKGRLGGTCVNVGCIPSKYLLELSHKYYYAKHKSIDGIEFEARLDFQKVMESLRGLVDRLREEKYSKVLASYPNIEVINGIGYFTASNELMIESNGYKFNATADNIIIATGSSPSIPNIEGLDKVEYLTSNTIWDINDLPESLAIIGGGAIGLEIGQAFMHLGSKVHVFEALPRIAYQAEPEISNALQAILENEGMEFHLKSRVASVKRHDSKVDIEVISKDGRKYVEVERLLIATGRKPNTQGLRLDKASIDTNKHGFIKVNAKLQTTNPKVYAAGDVIEKQLMLETLAAREGIVAAMNILNHDISMDYNSIPWAIFTHPNLAGVGMNEYEVMDRFGACACRILPLSMVPKARLLDEQGLAKMVIHPKDGRILGVQVLAPYAAEFITEIAIAMKNNLTFKDLIDTIHVFPTINEVLKINAQSFIRDVRRMSCCME